MKQASSSVSERLLASLATFSTFTLGVGNHSISATPTGSANDDPSASPVLTQIVAAAPLALTPTADSTPANQGQAVSIAGTVCFLKTFQGQTTTLATATLAGPTAPRRPRPRSPNSSSRTTSPSPSRPPPSLSTASGCTVSYPLNRVAPGTCIVPVTANDPASGITLTAQWTLSIGNWHRDRGMTTSSLEQSTLFLSVPKGICCCGAETLRAAEVLTGPP